MLAATVSMISGSPESGMMPNQLCGQSGSISGMFVSSDSVVTAVSAEDDSLESVFRYLVEQR